MLTGKVLISFSLEVVTYFYLLIEESKIVGEQSLLKINGNINFEGYWKVRKHNITVLIV